MINPIDLPEFQYYNGDPRPVLVSYLMKECSSQVDTYVETKKPHFIEYKCVKENATNKHIKIFTFPHNTKERLQYVIENGTKPFVIIPILIINKFKCAKRNRAQHMIYVLYNRVRNEAQRIDVKKMHIKNFFAKAVFKKVRDTFIPQNLTTSTRMDHEVEIPSSFSTKYFEFPARSLYPIYLINYLVQRVKNPLDTLESIHTKVSKKSWKNITNQWENYANLSMMYKTNYKCNDDHIPNFELNKCIPRKATTLNKLAVSKPVLDCPEKKVYNMFTGRCTDPKRIKDINIMLDEVIQANAKSNTKFISVGSTLASMQAFNFIIEKYNGVGHLVAKFQKPGNSKKNFFVWNYNKQTKKHELTIPKDFWEAWEDGMDSDARFLFVLIRIIEPAGGVHANMLIYDKDKHTLERFDPLGKSLHIDYNIADFDNIITGMMDEQKGKLIASDYKYIIPKDVWKYEGFQSKELDEVGYDDMMGNCAVWRVWYADIRMANPHLTSKELIKMAHKKIEHFGSFQKFIKSYQKYLMNNVDLQISKD